ncbi:MAG: AMP-dependent synthetase and ligase [Ilumatobacteraceae bacterium]|nr:AMP-dependent synthetase and ligase [Ilumatobacteraceae bacterium]MCU1386743.1 AMP-dependent synthetase and ligase [Ilumatobacteraceae bacterium]
MIEPALETVDHPWTGYRIPDMIERSADLWPDRKALIDGDVSVTYREFYDAIRSAAAGLRSMSIGEQDRVALLLPQSWQHMVILYALMYIGAVPVPLNLTWEPPEIATALENAGVTCLIGGGQHRDRSLTGKLHDIGIDPATFSPRPQRFPQLREVIWATGTPGAPVTIDRLISTTGDAAPGGSNPVAFIMFTSGSTAFPKAAVIRHDAALNVAHYVGRAVGVDEDDRYLNVAPLYHCAGLIAVLLVAHMTGGSVTLFDGYQHDIMVEAMWQEQSTVLIGFDVVTMRLVQSALERYGSVPFRRMISGPGINIYDQLTELGIDLHIMYGMTEGTNVVSITAGDDPSPARRNSNGLPLPGVDVRVCDPETGRPVPTGQYGEIGFRGWLMTPGYLQPDGSMRLELDEDGYFRSGDYGFLDDEGRVHYRGRYSMMVKTGGENVSQVEVENFLMSELASVRQAAVVGVPDDVWGEKVVAFVETIDDTFIDLPTVQQASKGRLAGYKVPKMVVQLRADEWPVTATGKIIKSDLVARLVGQIGS